MDSVYRYTRNAAGGQLVGAATIGENTLKLEDKFLDGGKSANNEMIFFKQIISLNILRDNVYIKVVDRTDIKLSMFGEENANSFCKVLMSLI